MRNTSKRPHERPSSEKLSLLFDLSRSFSARIEIEELLPLINAQTKDVLDAESCAILLLDAEKRELYFPITSDLSPEVESRFKKIRFPANKGIAGWVLEHDESALVLDVRKDKRFYPDVDRQSGAQTRDLLYAPLRTRRGVVGVIGLRNKRIGTFTEDDVTFLDAIAGVVAIAIENARLYAQVKASEERLRTEVGVLRRDLARRDRFTEIVGTGPAMAEVFRLMASAAASSISVLIEGETGTGKELVARAIHRESERGEGPFVGVNCAALSETLLESELFGYCRGAFTGAERDKRGLFEAATGGTIFLDEVAETPATMQAKLLRVLQNREIIPVGDSRARKVDVRVISATNRTLEAEVAARRFREDLYYRLAAFPILLPPLRERPEDIPLLASRVATSASERYRKRILGIDPAAVDLMVRSDWPGNVRELENTIERAVALARDGETIAPRHLSPKVQTGRSSLAAEGIIPARTNGEATGAGGSPARSLRHELAEFEARYIAKVLKQYRGNVSRAAQALGMSRVTLHKKLKEFGRR